ncbi:Ig-like domain-containing protein [Oceanicoccus sagamiensis]|uniref:BIG2 domain-containing protein n=1 Tax=Oceanicoccus sagamiensis TaxID=716816 RepID=A0A1X9N8I0_9GAMM|nr:Ig-like domain-containing protein [Oceanicoccus sagamiensis]ARN74378.1 hypothetical protein BST96_09735 [Oceanicoccus sagamiensis]
MLKHTTFLLLVSVFLTACFPDNNSLDFKGDTLTTITVTPAFNRTLVGATQSYQAVGTFEDGSSKDITDTVSWTSSNNDIATVTANGQVEALAAGRVIITATEGAISGGATLAVFEEDAFELVILPGNAAEPVGATVQYQALVYLASRSSVDVTDLVTWSSSAESTVSIAEGGLATFNAEGSVTISASWQAGSASVPATVTSAVLQKLLVDPISQTGAAGTTVQYQATGIYSDGNSADLTNVVSWSSADSQIATIDNTGQAALLTAGETQMTAAIDAFTANAQLTVTGASIETLQILPAAINAPAGTAGQLVLLAAYSDGAVVDVAASALWESGDSDIALVQSSGTDAGFTQLLRAGSTTINAAFDGLETSAAVTVSAAQLKEIILEPVNTTAAEGFQVQYSATGIYSDGSRESLKAEVSWQSSDSSIAVINNQGLASTVEVGATLISASKEGIIGETTLTVTDATLTRVDIIPGSVSKPVGRLESLKALAQYSDGSIADVTTQSTWSSSDDPTLFVTPKGDSAGVIIGRMPGEAMVSVNYQGQTDTIPVTITEAELVAIVVEPSNASIANGRSQQYTATGLYSDGTSSLLGKEVSWLSSNPEVATISLDGLAVTLTAGETTISASFSGIDAETSLTVTPAQVTLMQVFPVDIEAPLGAQGQLNAVATYSDGTVADVTAESTWESSNSGIAYVVNDGANAGYALATGEGSAQISASFSAVSATSPVLITAAVLQSINVEPVDATIPKGVEQVYTATGFYSDNTSQDLTSLVAWQSADAKVATIDATGRAKGEAEGSTVIQAQYQGVIGQTNLTITAAALTGLQISPANPSAPAGASGEFVATAYYSDLSTKVVTTETTWLSSDSNTVVVSPTTGAADFIAQGSATITANFQGQSDTTTATVTEAILVSVVVDPAVIEVANGIDVQYRALAIYSDNSGVELGSGVVWDSLTKTVAVISPGGLAETLAAGATHITASFGGKVGGADLRVNAAEITEIKILQPDFELPLGTKTQLEAVAYFTDGTSIGITSSASWSSSNPDILSVTSSASSRGEVLARGLGTAAISVNYQGFSDSANGTVTDAVLNSISLSPLNTSTAKGVDVQYTAIGLYSDDTSEPLTNLADWQSSDTSVATVASSGKASTLKVGSTTITASYSGVSAQTSLNVTAAVVESLQVTPAALTEPAGTSGQLTATAYYSDSSSENVTQQAAWASSNTEVVSVITTGDNAGFTQLLTPGNATITASFNGVTDVVEIVVTPAVLVSIEVNPALATVAEGIPVRYEAIGIFSDGSSSPINEDVTWQSSNTDIAVIGPAGIALTHGVGSTVISASVGEEETISTTGADVQLNVTDAIPLALQIVPGNLMEPAGTSGQQIAVAFFSDFSAQDVTKQSTWVSSDSSIVTVVASGENAGFTELLAPGLATITATFQGVSRTVNVEVTPAELVSIEISPVDQSVPKGLEVQYNATGIFTDGSSSSINSDVVWQSSDTGVATIDENGLANTLPDSIRDISTTIISASFDGITASTSLTVTDAIVLSLQITPSNLTEPAGTSGQLTATAFYSDNTSKDVTTSSTWSSSNTTIVDVVTTGEKAGLATLLVEGEAVVTATIEGVPDQVDIVVTTAVLQAIQVDPRLSQVPEGLEVAYNATGFFSDGSSSPINEDVSWISSDPDVAVITFDGVAITQAPGSVAITAAVDIGTGGIPDIISGAALLGVNTAEVVSIQVTPPFLTEPAGTSGQLQATAVLTNGLTDDITQAATWTSSNPEVASVVTTGENAGFTQLLRKGTATITASAQGKSTQIPVEVTDAVLVDIQVDPVNAILTEGNELQYNANGEFSDGTVTPINTDVSWVTGNNSIATITIDGLATGITAGATTVRAAVGDISTTTDLTVTNPVLVELQVSPIDTSLIVKQSQQYQATGIYDNSDTQDLSNTVTWVTDTEFATISNSARSSATSSASKGLLNAIKATPETLVTASLINSNNDLISNSATLEITEPTLDFVTIRPGRQDLPAGSESQWTAEATFTNSDTVDVTNDASWASSDPGIATVIDGLVLGVAAGTANISINYEGETDTLPVTVTAPDLQTISVTPTFSILGLNTAQQMIATANYSDGSNLVITDTATWSSLNSDKVSISNAGGSKGIATALAVGTSNVSADQNGVNGDEAVVDAQELVLLQLKVSPRTTTMSEKSNQLFFATAIYNGGSESDVTSQVTWTTSDNKVVNIENSDSGDKKTFGLATAKKAGTATITATWPQDDSITDSASVTVTEKCKNDPVSVFVKPSPATISLNGELQFELITVDDEGCETNETYEKAHWHVADDDEDIVSMVHKEGVATGLSLGTATIDGEYNKDNIEFVTVTVIPEEVALVKIAAEDPATIVDYTVEINGAPVSLTCDMQQVDGGILQPPEDITSQATWISADNSIASVVDSDANPQVVNGVAVGITEVTCYHGGKRANITIDVVAP